MAAVAAIRLFGTRQVGRRPRPLGVKRAVLREIDYFATSAQEKPLLHTWSLAVEEQFYLFVPIFLLLVGRTRRLRWLFILVAGIAALSFGLSIYRTARHPSSTFYLLPTRAWELLVGVLLAICASQWTLQFSASSDSATFSKSLVQSRWPRIPSRFNTPAGLLGLTFIILPCLLYDQNTPFPGLAALPPVLGAAMLIASGSSPGRPPLATRLMCIRPFVGIGLISYSLYLWHWPLFAFARYSSLVPLRCDERLGLVALSLILALSHGVSSSGRSAGGACSRPARGSWRPPYWHS